MLLVVISSSLKSDTYMDYGDLWYEFLPIYCLTYNYKMVFTFFSVWNQHLTPRLS